MKTKSKRKKSNTKISMIVLAVFILLIGGGLFARYLYNQHKLSYIMTFDGKKISSEDYRFFLLTQSSEDENAKESAFSALAELLVLDKAAQERNFTLTDEEHEALMSDADYFQGMIKGYGIDPLDMADEHLAYLMSGSYLYDKLLEALNVGYELNEEEFQESFADYVENGKQYYIDTQMKYFITETEEAAQEARDRVLAGESMDDMIREYSLSYDEETGIELIALSEISFEQDIIDGILALEVSGLSDIIALDSGFVVFEIFSIDIPTDEELEQSARENYIQNQKADVFNEEFSKWTENCTIELNQTAYDTY